MLLKRGAVLEERRSGGRRMKQTKEERRGSN